MIVCLLVSHLVLFSITYVSSQNSSPCPDVFTYEPKGTDEDRWYGVMSLTTPDDLTGVWITIQLDKPAELLGNWFGEAVSTDNKEYRISNHDYKLEAGPPVSVRFFVKYDRFKSIPSLQAIRLNGKLICSSQKNQSELGPTTPKLHISRPGTTKKPVSSSNSGNRPISTTGGRPGSRPSVHREPGGKPNTKPTSSRPSTANSIIGDVFERPSQREPDESNQGVSSNIGSRPASRPSDHNTGFNDNRQPGGYEQPSYSNSGFNSNGGPSSYEEPYQNNQGQFSGSVSRPSSSNSDRREETGQSSVSLNNQNRYPAEPGVITRPTNTRPSGTSGSNFNSGYPAEPGVINRPTNTRPATGTSGSNFNSGSSLLGTNNGNTLSAPDNESGEDLDFFPGDFANIERPAQSRPASRPQSSSAAAVSGCGVVAARPSPLISNGQDTTPGQWPWHAALYHSKGIQLIYTCGGTLISSQHIITAGHCVTKPHSNKVVDFENMLVYLGKYNLLTFGPEVQDRDVSDIVIHPEYNQSVYFNDIAILKLSRPVDITNFVRPCCLWSEDTNLESIISKQGTVVGWGFDESKKLSNKLMQAQMPVVSTVTCIYSNREFFSQFTFEKNFCAGFRNGTSVCNGDSGGGMVFPKRGTRGQSTVWQLRGVVSVGVALQGQGICDTSQYIVFTDVAKHLPWIRQQISN